MQTIRAIAPGGGLLPLLLSGRVITDADTMAPQLRMEQERPAQLESTVSELESRLGESASMLGEKDMKIASCEEPPRSDTASGLLPVNARAGERYARLFAPPQYEIATGTVLKTEATGRVDITEPQLDWQPDNGMAPGKLTMETPHKLDVL